MLGLSDWPVKSNHCEQTQQNPLLPPSSHQEVIPMATAGQFPFCTWGWSNFLKKPPFLAAFPSWLLKRDWMWCTMNAAWRQQPQPALYDWQWSLRGKERREKRPLRVFGASLSVSIELKFCLPPPPPSPWINLHWCGWNSSRELWTVIGYLLFLCSSYINQCSLFLSIPFGSCSIHLLDFVWACWTLSQNRTRVFLSWCWKSGGRVALYVLFILSGDIW